MDRKELLKVIVLLMILLFALDRLASKFYWYFTIWWFDMPMHFFGGVWVGLFFLYAYKMKVLNPRSILGVILSVLVMGIAWEIFELYVFNGIGHYPFNLLDTISDVLLDISGGFFAMVYFSKGTMTAAESAIQLR